MSTLDQLKKVSTVVSDSADFGLIHDLQPTDATTNPSLVLAAAQKPEYVKLLNDAASYGRDFKGTEDDKVDAALDRLLVLFGCEILKLLPGRVSTEVDARFSFDKEATINKTRHILDLYKEQGVSKERILIKIASTWEGIQAGRELEEKYGIHCNMTVIFNMAQAIACGEAGVTLISPFNSRMTDWYTKHTGKTYKLEEEPGVEHVKRVYELFKQRNYKTQVMGASFKTTDQILAIAGCDLITINPVLLKKLQTQIDKVERKLAPSKVAANGATDKQTKNLTEAEFRWMMNEDPCTVESVPEVIRKFSADALTLKQILKSLF